MIKRDYLREELKRLLAEKSNTPVPLEDKDPKGSYKLGQVLGYQDGIKDAMHLIEILPVEPPRPKGRYVLGDPSTYKYAPSNED